jgi:hypothetical protein
MMAYSPATGETVAKPMVRLFQRLRLRWSVPGALVAATDAGVSGPSVMRTADLPDMAAGLTVRYG